MKGGKRRLTALALLFLMIVSVPAALLAEEQNMSSVEQQGVTATIKTDKDSYEAGEKVKVTYSIENEGRVNVSKAQIQYVFDKTLIAQDDKAFATSAQGITKDAPFSVTGELKGDESVYGAGSPFNGNSSIIIIAVAAAVVVIIIIVVVVVMMKKKKNVPPAAAALFVLVAAGLVSVSLNAHAVTASKNTIVVKKEITYAGEKVNLQVKADVMVIPVLNTIPADKKETNMRVSVHDPSVVKAEDGSYYIYGSHLAFAKTTDLQNWQMTTNNINTNYNSMFGKVWTDYCTTQSNPSLSGNMWAPDVFYNKVMKKWCFYMSINGSDFNSSVALLTADKITGPYEYVGQVVYSGFNTDTHDANKTDVYKVLGQGADLTRYQSTSNTKLNCIDPCIVEDEKGNMYMVFGSWFGGIYMLDLDENTGLRDYSVKYKTVANESDEYYGYKIAGGNGVSGEAPFIEKMGDYYFLFLSYGGLEAAGGYNMRVFRSDKVTGPYVDVAGNPAIYKTGGDNINGHVGMKIMGNYQWSTMSKGEVAQGHNSVLVDGDKCYLVYHTRFDNGGEGHEVRVHQMFLNEDGWLVAAPYEYKNEELNQAGYKKEEVTGEYEFILHKHDISYGTKEVAGFETVNLNDDGTVSGDYEGTWEMKDGTPYVTLKIDGKDYKGVFVKMNVSESKIETMTFTAVADNNVCIWGSKKLQ